MGSPAAVRRSFSRGGGSGQSLPHQHKTQINLNLNLQPFALIKFTFDFDIGRVFETRAADVAEGGRGRRLLTCGAVAARKKDRSDSTTDMQDLLRTRLQDNTRAAVACERLRL
mmetsp:Transcript_24862/g.54044  ORF Transcript_24862/g.54044 Transcript_24862/m.54044 type:complete len:113 (+) Transcript_24862:3-341(+)